MEETTVGGLPLFCLAPTFLVSTNPVFYPTIAYFLEEAACPLEILLET